jgi:6-phosphogluconolactonase
VQLQVFDDEQGVAEAGARHIAAAARSAVAARGRFVVALSGGRTPVPMLAALAHESLPWDCVQVFQVDERVAPPGDAARNLTSLQALLVDPRCLRPDQIHAMPVEAEDLDLAAGRYAATLRAHAGTPPQLDLVHLGLGTDGHAASLVPGSPVLDEAGIDVAVTGPYQGHRRMTLTYPAINRARQLMWLVTGAGKQGMLRRLRQGDWTIPAGRVAPDRAIVLADRAAAGSIEPRRP